MSGSQSVQVVHFTSAFYTYVAYDETTVRCKTTVSGLIEMELMALHAIDHMWSRRGGTGKPYSNSLGNVRCSNRPVSLQSPVGHHGLRG